MFVIYCLAINGNMYDRGMWECQTSWMEFISNCATVGIYAAAL